jgi:hypothetical protein
MGELQTKERILSVASQAAGEGAKGKRGHS